MGLLGLPAAAAAGQHSGLGADGGDRRGAGRRVVEIEPAVRLAVLRAMQRQKIPVSLDDAGATGCMASGMRSAWLRS